MTATARDRIREAVSALARRTLSYEGELSDNTVIADTVAADSLARMTLLVELENTFQIEIDDAEALTLTTVGELITFLASRVPAPPNDAQGTPPHSERTSPC